MRTFSKTLTLMGLLAPVGVNALGVGEIKLNSALNQMLKAEIPLITTGSEANSEIKVNLASPSAFAQAGIERPYFLTRLRFTPVVENGQVVVKVTSRDVIREPFLNFLLEVNWPNGHTLREFTVLLDPPSTFDDETITAIRAPQVESRTVAEPRIPLDRRADATVADKGPEPAKREVPPEKKQKVAQEKKTPDFVRSKHNDTLWALAKRAGKDRSVSHMQMMIALFEANPKAFYRKNINALKAGQRLRIPARQTILRLSRGSAIAQYRAQNDQWRGTVSSSAPAEPSTLTSPVQSADRSESGASTKFELASADSGKSDSKSSGESSSVGKQEIAPEVVDSLRQENTELRKRLKEDEEQLNRLNKLLELKDQQLSALQSSRPAGVSVAEKPADTSGKAVDEKALPSESVADLKTLDNAAEDEKLAATPPADQSAKSTSAENLESGEKTTAPSETTVVASIEIPAQTKSITDTATANDTAKTEENTQAEGTKASEPSAATQQAPATTEVDKSETSSTVASPATTIESATGVSPPPAAAESTPAPQEVERDFVDELLAEPDYLMMGGGIAVVLGLIGWILVRRSRRNLTDDQESFMDLSVTGSDADSDKEAGGKTTPGLASENSGMVESSFLSEFTPSDFDAIESDHEEVDPVSEADVYLAYGRYQQAEDLIRNAIETYPERDECKLKLLEIYFVTENRKAFEEYAGTLAELKQEKPKIWAKVVEMGRELCADSPLFKPGQVSLQKESTDDEPVLDLTKEIPPVVDLQKSTTDTTEPASNDDELTFEIDDAFNVENELSDLEPLPESDDSLDFDSKLSDDDNAIEFERFGELASADLSSASKASKEMERSSKSELSDDLKALELASDAAFDQTIDQSIEAEQTTSTDSLSEFSDLTDMDEIETKLDLAKAYFDMDDQESARGILAEVLLEGNDEQKSQARALVDMMEHKV